MEDTGTHTHCCWDMVCDTQENFEDECPYDFKPISALPLYCEKHRQEAIERQQRPDVKRAREIAMTPPASRAN